MYPSRSKKLIALDMGALIAGAKFRVVKRLKAVLKEVTDSGGNIFSSLMKFTPLSGRSATKGAMDASNLLKPMLARGELRCIGATT